MLLQELNALSELLIGEFRKELKDQGHNLSGRLSKSLQITPIFNRGQITLLGSFFNYGAPVDQGVTASKIPFTPGSGKKSSKYIDGLIRFVKLRRIETDDKKAKSVAFAIAFKHKKEGMPTKSSFKFSKNGRRRGWISHVLDSNEQVISELISDIFENEVNTNIDNLIKRNT